VARLENYGFAALYLNRKGYEDRAEKLLKELEAMGYHRRLQSSGGQQVVVLLHPKPKPVMPLGESLTFGSGWHARLDDGIRWANDDAVMSYFNPYDRPLTAKVRLKLMGVTPRDLTLALNDHPVGTMAVTEQPLDWPLELVLVPGVNCIKLSSSSPAVRLGTGRYQLRTFGLQESSIEVLAPPVNAE
jgi:hypothetical protein